MRSWVAYIRAVLALAALVGSATGSATEPVVTDTLLTQLKSSDVGERLQAAEALGERAAEAEVVVPALITVLDDREYVGDGHPSFAPRRTVGVAASESLVKIGKPATSALVAQLNAAANEAKLHSVLETLRKIGGPAPEAVPRLEKLVETHETESIRYAALVAWATLREQNADAVAYLTARLKDELPGMRAHAAKLLGELGADSLPAVDQLVALLGDDAPYYVAISDHALDSRPVRQGAASALGMIGPKAKSATPSLLRMMREDDDSRVQQEAALALARIEGADSTGLDFLIKTLDDRPVDEDSMRVSDLLFALGELGPVASRALPQVTACLHDRNPYVRGGAVSALAAISGREAIPQIKPFLADDDAFVRAEANGAIESFQDKSSDGDGD